MEVLRSASHGVARHVAQWIARSEMLCARPWLAELPFVTARTGRTGSG
jgi:hypothetical protein